VQDLAIRPYLRTPTSTFLLPSKSQHLLLSSIVPQAIRIYLINFLPSISFYQHTPVPR
jgi:hypothetical protein